MSVPPSVKRTCSDVEGAAAGFDVSKGPWGVRGMRKGGLTGGEGEKSQCWENPRKDQIRVLQRGGDKC